MIREGFGLYNDLQDGLSYRLDQNAPFNTSIALPNISLSNFPIYPGQIPASSKITPEGVQQNIYTPTVISWTIKVQQQLTPNTSLSVGYVGSHGYHETLSADLNQPFATICPALPCPASRRYDLLSTQRAAGQSRARKHLDVDLGGKQLV